MRYSMADFMAHFPNDDTCLQYVFERRYPDHKGYYRIKKRLAFANHMGCQIYPLKGTIFERSRTPLVLWFYAIYLFSISKNGVAAKELERHLGVTYKTAWRMAGRIRRLMRQDHDQLTGVVEADETYVGGRRRSSCAFKDKVPVLGVVQRGGHIRVKALKNRGEYQIAPFIEKNVKKQSLLYTDEARVYGTVMGYKRDTVKHRAFEFVRGEVHTNTIEGFWGQFKRSLHGTHHSVSKQYLQSYLDEFAFRYNHRMAAFEKLLERI